MGKWIRLPEELVFKEQLATGSFRRFKVYAPQLKDMSRQQAEVYEEFLELHEEKLQEMRKAAQEGRIEPHIATGHLSVIGLSLHRH